MLNPTKRPILLAYVLIGLSVIAGFTLQKMEADERKKQICTAELEDRHLLDQMINFQGSGTPSTTPEMSPDLRRAIEESRARAQEFQEYADGLLEIPPDICDGTGITIDDIRREAERRSRP